MRAALKYSGMLRRIAPVGAAWFGLAFLALLGLLPAWPRTLLGWAVLLLVGPAILLVAEAVGEAMDADPVGRWLAQRTGSLRFSVLRIGYLFVQLAVTASIVLTLSWAASRNEAMTGWFHNHFGPMSNKSLHPAAGGHPRGRG